jgi:predicted nucleotidyltransferase
VRETLKYVGDQLSIREAYVFGSQADGTANEWSDIDIAVFVDGIEGWGLAEHRDFAVNTQMQAGEDIDLHLYLSRELAEPAEASFARWIIDNGVRIYP